LLSVLIAGGKDKQGGTNIILEKSGKGKKFMITCTKQITRGMKTNRRDSAPRISMLVKARGGL